MGIPSITNVASLACSQQATLQTEAGLLARAAAATTSNSTFQTQAVLLEKPSAKLSLLASCGRLLQPAGRASEEMRRALEMPRVVSSGAGGGSSGGGDSPNMLRIREAITQKDVRFLLNILYAGSKYAHHTRAPYADQAGVSYTIDEAQVALRTLMEWQDSGMQLGSGVRLSELASTYRYWAEHIDTEISRALITELARWLSPTLKKIRSLASSNSEEDWREILRIARESTSPDEVRTAVESIFSLGCHHLLNNLATSALGGTYGRSLLQQCREEIVQRINDLKLKEIQEATRDELKKLIDFIRKEGTPFNASEESCHYPYSFATVKAAVDRILELYGSTAMFELEGLKYSQIYEDPDFLAYIQSRTHVLLFHGAVAPEREVVSKEGIEQRPVWLPVNHSSGRMNLEVGNIFSLRPGEDYLLTRKLGSGAIVDVYLGEASNPRRLVALRNIKPHDLAGDKDFLTRTYTARLVSEIRALHTLAEAFEREPERNFPGGIKRNYFPIPYSGVRAAQFGVLAVELCLGPDEGEYAAKLKPDERIPLSMQILHALTIAEGAGILNTDIKPIPVQAHVVDGTAKFLDWNVTQPPSALPHKNRDRARTIVNEWLLASAKMLHGTTNDPFLFHKDSQGKEDLSLIQEIHPDKSWSAVFKAMVFEAVVQNRFSTVREAYQRFLQLSESPPPTGEEQFDTAFAQFNERYKERVGSRENMKVTSWPVYADLADYAGRDSALRERLHLYGDKIDPETGCSVKEGIRIYLKGQLEGLTITEAQRLLPRLREAIRLNGELPGLDFIGILLELFPELKS